MHCAWHFGPMHRTRTTRTRAARAQTEQRLCGAVCKGRLPPEHGQGVPRMRAQAPGRPPARRVQRRGRPQPLRLQLHLVSGSGRLRAVIATAIAAVLSVRWISLSIDSLRHSCNKPAVADVTNGNRRWVGGCACRAQHTQLQPPLTQLLVRYSYYEYSKHSPPLATRVTRRRGSTLGASGHGRRS